MVFAIEVRSVKIAEFSINGDKSDHANEAIT
jgi:hypothetical protein